MFDKLDDMLIHYEELMLMLGDPDVTQDTKRFTRLMKEQADLAPIVEAYKQYKQAKQDVEDSLALLEEENDEEMREMAKEELSDARKRIEDLEHELKILLLPKTLTMTRTSFWKSGQAQAETRQHCLRPNFTACIQTMRTARDGRWRLSALMKTASAVSRKWLPWLRARARTPSLNMRAACTASSVCLRQNPAAASIHPLPLWPLCLRPRKWTCRLI